ncbi:hypothetical protein [Ferruginibacter sp. SUN106]|uniref:hypothetical protein n=1 Tax=Ferruginibacter sp. SUN106 TaxID=2978348 RepID=UPI003D35D373
MDILKSNKHWKCKLLLFSGRPDPEWQPGLQVIEKLLVYANEIPASADTSDFQPPLGYRGALIHNGSYTITAYKGRLEIRNADAIIIKPDEERRFERLILETAPEELRLLAMQQFD